MAFLKYLKMEREIQTEAHIVISCKVKKYFSRTSEIVLLCSVIFLVVYKVVKTFCY